MRRWLRTTVCAVTAVICMTVVGTVAQTVFADPPIDTSTVLNQRTSTTVDGAEQMGISAREAVDDPSDLAQREAQGKTDPADTDGIADNIAYDKVVDLTEDVSSRTEGVDRDTAVMAVMVLVGVLLGASTWALAASYRVR